MNGPFKTNMKLSQRVFSIVMIPLHCYVIPLLLGVVIAFAMGGTGIEISAAYSNLACYSVSAILVFAVLYKYLKNSFYDIFDNIPRFFGAVAVGVLMYYMLSVAMAMLSTIITVEAENPNAASINEAAMENGNVMIVVAVILGPIVEECLFRGAIFGGLVKKNRVAAYIVSIAAFCLYHMAVQLVSDFSWMLFISALEYAPGGYVLARTYEKGGTIWAAIALHAILNAIALTAII